MIDFLCAYGEEKVFLYRSRSASQRGNFVNSLDLGGCFASFTKIRQLPKKNKRKDCQLNEFPRLVKNSLFKIRTILF